MCRDKEPRSGSGTGPSLRKLVKEACGSTGCLRRKSTAHLHQRSSQERRIGQATRSLVEGGYLRVSLSNTLGWLVDVPDVEEEPGVVPAAVLRDRPRMKYQIR